MTEDMKGVLERIESPADLKGLTSQERRILAAEIRETILNVVSKTGGHLASNLGTVELTIALHTVWDAPKDIIIFDTGHQAYPHKLLTGRRDQFHTIRQGGGLSGFLRREESPYDVFGAGHAGTSISAALGFAEARDLRGSDEEVVAVIGDSALTAGMALEALNHAGELKANIKVILNDNSMSIAQAVGALSYHLARLRSQPLLHSLEQRAKDFIQHLKVGRKAIEHAAEGLKLGMAHLMSPGEGPVFENLGFTYLGPIDGHNTEELIEIFRAVREMKEPVLVHVVTTKGKGVEYAENDARVFHGVTPFDTGCGKFQKKEDGNPTWTSGFSQTLLELAEADERIVAITAAMPDGTGLAAFAERFPERFYDVAIAEQHAVTFAAGLAASGLRPVVAIYSTFLQRAFDQVLHDVCIQHLPVIFCLDRAGLVGDDGATHQGVFDLSYLRLMPGIVIMAPSDLQELADMLLTAVQHDGPIAIRYPRGSCPRPWEKRKPRPIPIGRGRTLREGSDVALVACGSSVITAEQAAEMLHAGGISAEVIDARFVKPLDEQRLCAAARKCGRMVVLEENALAGGFGSAVLELLSVEVPACRVSRVGVPDRFLEHDTQQAQRREVGLTAEQVAERARELTGAAGKRDARKVESPEPI